MPAAPANDQQFEVPAVRGAGMNPPIRVVRDYYDLRIYFGEMLHLHIDSDKFIGMQAWTDNEHSYTIEYTLTGGTLRTEYTTEAKWLKVLEGLEEVL